MLNLIQKLFIFICIFLWYRFEEWEQGMAWQQCMWCGLCAGFTKGVLGVRMTTVVKQLFQPVGSQMFGDQYSSISTEIKPKRRFFYLASYLESWLVPPTANSENKVQLLTLRKPAAWPSPSSEGAWAKASPVPPACMETCMSVRNTVPLHFSTFNFRNLTVGVSLVAGNIQATFADEHQASNRSLVLQQTLVSVSHSSIFLCIHLWNRKFSSVSLAELLLELSVKH